MQPNAGRLSNPPTLLVVIAPPRNVTRNKGLGSSVAQLGSPGVACGVVFALTLTLS